MPPQATLSGVLASPQQLVLRGLQQTSLSLTIGIFVGSALTSGAVCGVAAFYLTFSDRLLKRVRESASTLASTLADPVGGAAALAKVLALGGGSDGLLGLVRSGKKIICVGKNYRDHIAELAQLGPDWRVEEQPEPVLFLKPTTAYAFPGQPLVLRDPARRPRRRCGTEFGVHHELELAVVIGRRCRHLPTDADAAAAVAGYALALDITDRDEQTEAKRAGMPWSVAKGHDSYCPLSTPFLLPEGGSWRELRMWLDVNGTRRQECSCAEMIRGVEELVRFCSSVMTLEPGDVLLTGTPAGVGRIRPGDVVTAGVEGHVQMVVAVVAEE
mmetsp:Transcript_33166/g.110681  ORF Transcript_33166/g.110681 Transcript_33166/m.110681 type:complete len:328 (-) Transcript_33166:164-1147(-)